MKPYSLYILTDCNRKTLHMGVTQDISQELRKVKEWYGLFVDSSALPTRLVYQETFATEEAALARYACYQSYTRMQSEKLIRRANPNWIDLYAKQVTLRASISSNTKTSPLELREVKVFHP